MIVRHLIATVLALAGLGIMIWARMSYDLNRLYLSIAFWAAAFAVKP